MTLEADTFLIFSLKEATEADPEVDFVINDIKYVAEAISTAGEDDLSEKEERLKAKFPRNMTMTTYRPLFRYIERAVQIRKHEAEMVAKGMPIDNTPQDRTYKALNWEGWDLKNNVARQIGNC